MDSTLSPYVYESAGVVTRGNKSRLNIKGITNPKYSNYPRVATAVPTSVFTFNILIQLTFFLIVETATTANINQWVYSTTPSILSKLLQKLALGLSPNNPAKAWKKTNNEKAKISVLLAGI